MPIRAMPVPRLLQGTCLRGSSINSDIVTLDGIIVPNEKDLFFTELGISLSAPAGVQHENAVIGLSSRNWYSRHRSIDLCLRGKAQYKAHHTVRYIKPVIVSAQFNKLQKEHSWAALKYFLTFLYYPALYIEEIEMLALNQKMIDDLFDGETRFLRCNAFTLRGETDSSNMDEFRESLSWLEQNVSANTIHFPEHIDYKNENIYVSIANFLLDASWKCARQEVNFKCVCNVESFVKAIVQKFQSDSYVQKDVPLITASSVYDNNGTISFLQSDPNVLKLKSQDSKVIDVYIISSGENRMQIEIFEKHVHGNQNTNYAYRGIGYGHRKFHDNWQNNDVDNNYLHKLDVYIKVNAV